MTVNKALKTFCILFVTLLTWSGAGCVYAQNNPYHINDKLLPLYIRAFNIKKQPDCLPVADSLRREAIKAGDRYGELYALNIPFYHEYFKPKNMTGLERAMKPLSTKAQEYGLWDFYYLAMSNKVSYYLREHRYLEALLYRDTQEEYARLNKHNDGIRWALRMKGVILQYRGELSQAIDCFEQTMDFSRKYTPRHDLAREYISLSDCYRMMGNFEQIKATAAEGQRLTANAYERRNLMAFEAYADFMLDNDSAFHKVWNEMAKGGKGVESNVPVISLALLACKHIADGNYNEAERVIGKVKKVSEEESLRLCCALNKRRGNYLKSMECMRKLISHNYEHGEEIMEYDIKSRDEIFYNQNIEREQQRIRNANTRLQLDNAELTLHNSRLELERSRDAAKLAIATAGNSSLAYGNQQLLARQLSDSLEKQRILLDTKMSKGREKTTMLIAIIIAAVAVMSIILVNTLHKRSLAKKLHAANDSLEKSIEELNTATRHARESEHMKTLFIQNMSHEIRTPLNAVVGFSQLLTDPDSQLEQDEKTDIAKYIADNSELLATLVGDIIDITNMQSDSYAMKMAEMSINDTCREALLTVDHRKAEGVELRFETTLDDSQTVKTDKSRVTQVLINMLTNAEKNTAEGSITLSCGISQTHPGMIVFSVADTGCGVPKDKLKYIFGRFHKLDHNKPGTGLGLDICRMIARKLGGEIDIDAEYTGGARFWFTIPYDND